VAGFLDKRQRILDVVLTDEGKRQLAEGGVDIAYFALVDDGVDYNPPSTGSQTLETYIETTPLLEALTGLPTKADPLEVEQLNARSILFTTSNADLVPSAALDSSDGAVRARREDGTVSDSATLILGCRVDDGSSDGFVLQAMQSGSDGPLWHTGSIQRQTVQDHLGVYRVVVR
jgi:hypothetical protein